MATFIEDRNNFPSKAVTLVPTARCHWTTERKRVEIDEARLPRGQKLPPRWLEASSASDQRYQANRRRQCSSYGMEQHTFVSIKELFCHVQPERPLVLNEGYLDNAHLRHNDVVPRDIMGKWPSTTCRKKVKTQGGRSDCGWLSVVCSDKYHYSE